MLVSFLILIVLVLALLVLQYYYFSYNELFFENMIVNTIGNIIILFATIFILERLINKHYEKRKLQEEKNRYLDVLGSRHDIFVNKLETLILHFIKKNPPVIEPRLTLTELRNTKDNLSTYIGYDFLRKNYTVNIIDENLSNQEVEVNYQRYCSYFKNEILKLTYEYSNRYLPLIPNDILDSIFRIEDNITTSNAFVIPEDHGMNLDISNAEFIPDLMITSIDKLLDEVIKLREYR